MRRLLTVIGLLLPLSAYAQEGVITDIPGCDFVTGDLQAACIPAFVAHMIQLLFGFTGILCLFNIMIGGYQIAIGAATGDKEKGKQRITWALIGLILSVAAYLILDVVLFRPLRMSPANNKKKASGFTSIRLIGRRAQDLLMKARNELHRAPHELHTVPMPESERGEEVIVHLSLSSVIRSAFAILAIVAGTWLTIQLIDVIILVLLAFFIAAIIDPGVRMFERMGVPRSLGIIAQYVVFLLFAAFLLISLIPIVAKQLQQLAIFMGLQVDAFLADPHIQLPLIGADLNARLTEITQAMVQDLSIDRFATSLQQFGQNLSTVAQGSLRFASQVAGSVLGFVVSMFIVLGLAFFIQLERELVRRWVRGFLPFRYRAYLDSKAEAIHHKIGQWARGQLALALCIGILVFVALEILGMPYALTLAVLAGFTEFIPYVGPFIAAVPAILIAGTQEGVLWMLVVAAVYYVIQWCENNLLVPLIMKRAVGLSPIAVIVAMLVGVSFPDVIHPILGILVSVPACTIIALFLEDWRTTPKD